MNKKYHFCLSALWALTLGIGLVACSSQDSVVDDLQQMDPDGQHTCELILNASRTGFDYEPSRSAAQWEDGDKIYLTFQVDEKTSYGDAIYKEGKWSLNYYGTLTKNETAKCTAVYFENPEFESSSLVKLSSNTGIYEDLNGAYIFEGDALTVTANLSPKTGRMRFSGSDQQSIKIYGIAHYTSYDCSNGKYTSSIGALDATVATDYTPYIYGYFTDEDEPRLNVITSTSGYTRLLPASIFKPADSGYMAIPTETAHAGWLNSLVLKVNDVEFTMLPVSGTIYDKKTSFFLAQTETTEQLYSAVYGAKPAESQFPEYNLSWNEWNSFLSRLSAITELKFRMPSLSEWQLAAKGGEKSQGYTYSGSNILSNVGWYTGNSGGTLHEVKQLQPNELGFYDMSGNVAEYTSTEDDSYSYYEHYYYCGGSIKSSAGYCTGVSKLSNLQYNESSGYTGLRIALSF